MHSNVIHILEQRRVAVDGNMKWELKMMEQHDEQRLFAKQAYDRSAQELVDINDAIAALTKESYAD